MPDIKTRDVARGTVKTIDKSATAAQRMKDAYIRTKRKTEKGVVYTAEGNSGDMCQESRYTVGYFEILRYGTPAY